MTTAWAGMYAPGAGGGEYAFGFILIPSSDGGRSKNSRDDSPKKLRLEPRTKLAVLQPVVAEPPLEQTPQYGCNALPPAESDGVHG